MPLTLAKKGAALFVTKINGGDEVRRHLENLGFVAGCEVSVVNELMGNLIVRIKESRIAISMEMAKRIFV
ncbi:MAG: ferrous iron transport protein A [Spirochaetaceae bacterium]|jgi:ferrous iron transport protein A|nr:ferrous iron transport protein A [Spirochaetaceae bacterium]